MFFGSDNQSGASPPIFEALREANLGFSHGYGDDQWTRTAVEQLKTLFECDLEVHFVSTGTIANCLALACLTRPWQSIFCQSTSHLINDESTAPEFFSGGARLVALPRDEGKICIEHLHTCLQRTGIHPPHNSEAGALSITQASETGLVYTPQEIQAISNVCKTYHIKLHMDGARFANALASLHCTAAELTWKAGVDVLSLGATKCGALCAEAVIFFDKQLARDFIYYKKRAGQMAAKGRFFGAQFAAWLQDNHWLTLAQHANEQAAQLADSLAKFDMVDVVYPVQTNQLFVTLPRQLARHLQEAGAEFYHWYHSALPPGYELKPEWEFIRLVTSFATSRQHRLDLLAQIEGYRKANAQ